MILIMILIILYKIFKEYLKKRDKIREMHLSLDFQYYINLSSISKEVIVFLFAK